jgi:uncharacterized damage-inducible protein DinB
MDARFDQENKLMSSHAMLQAHFGFNQAMNERLWAIIMEHLTDVQFVRTDGYSQGSIRNQLVHMANAEYYWLRGLLNVPDLPELDAEAYPTREAARAACRLADQECLKQVRGLSAADLQRIPGIWSQPVWVGLLQLAHHGTDHRAQILHALHDLGAPTFEQNFAVYMENVTPMSVQDLVGQIATWRGEWDDLLQQVPARQMDQALLKGWTVRDATAILTWQEQQVAAIIRAHAAANTDFWQLPKTEQARILAASRALPLPALREQAQAAQRELLEALRALTDDDLNTDHMEGLPPDERFWKVIAGPTWWSYADFCQQLRHLLAANEAGRHLE